MKFEHIVLKYKKIFLWVLLVFCAGGIGRAFAVLPASCDSEFYDVMEARATLQAKRDVEMAQTIILKPDSVLEYSCFMNRLIEVSGVAGKIFSGNVKPPLFQEPPMTYTPSGPYLPTIDEDAVTAPNSGQSEVKVGPNPPGGDLHADRLGNALGLLVTASLNEFMYPAFGHTFAGGTYAGEVSDVCEPMRLVWDFLRCKNFDPNLFMTFEELVDNDRRTHPVVCADTNRTSVWQDNIDKSYAAPGDPGGAEPVITYLDKLDSANCSSLGPIKTGIQVYRLDRGDSKWKIIHDDAVCVAAGCYYDGSACQ